MYKRIAAENRKYWQNRFLFGVDASNFAQEMLIYWNTNITIPAIASPRNEDLHLVDQSFGDMSYCRAPAPSPVPFNSVSLQLDKLYSKELLA